MEINKILANNFLIWDKLTSEEKTKITNAAVIKRFVAGEAIHHGSYDCSGLIILISGSLRAYMMNESGKQITLYRLFEKDICLFSASCIMKDITFDIYIDCEKDATVVLIPIDQYKEIVDNSRTILDYTNRILTSRFSDIMWIFEQMAFHSLDKRLAYYLIEQSYNEDSNTLNFTHEKIANDLGTAREVISRMLKYFELEKIVELKRNKIIILDEKKLSEISEK
ncbi:MAG TPA: Crp/Fnr family transcriptional regulator [Bacilli bacterium]|jgi:CRP/FNR family transcriptional regulator|nr:Crp/Fnr family transcriptional regulator [Bacilli bacterium]HOR17574.1 Crp/Fnr family transcriptional regulator [Bacilli bacterium]HPL55084.1 Crp/Fnr family transcriptional regulator [Bacilli bacterium]